MNRSLRRRWISACGMALLSLLLVSTASAANQIKVGAITVADHAVAPPLRDTAPIPPKWEGAHEKPRPLRLPAAATVPRADGALQSSAATAPSIGNVVSFNGLGVGGGYTPNAAPPDTNGAVGATQYVQWVNEAFGVYDKSTGALLFGPASGNTLFQALGATHPCALNNDGDPIAEYDKAANRWVMTQFSVTNGGSAGYWQCVAVSKTSDAISGGWNVYAFPYGTVDFNDYPKLGVWSDNYYITFNIFANGGSFSGSKICSYDRQAMLNGTTAKQVCFQLSSAFGGLLPADLDGSTPPPANSPEYFVAFGTNVLQLWKMSNVDFTAGTATLVGPTNIPAAAFSAACGGGGTCIPQKGTTQKLDSLADRLMYRLSYRNFGNHESLVVNHSVTAGSSVGVRWYEIRSPNTSPVIFQQGTFAPDASFRWMGSAATDQFGNIAVGYSVSSSTLNPGIRFTGRDPADPLGTMATEVTIFDGTGSQTSGLTRWGDYSALAVDPVDDCTLWYTTEYLGVNGSFNWSTRIGYFKFSTCGTVANPDFALAGSPGSQSVNQGSSTSYNVTVTPSGGFNGTVDFGVSGLPSGATANFVPTSVATSGSSTLTVDALASTPAGSYPLTITGTSGSLLHTATVTLVVTVPTPPDFSLSPTPASQTVTQGSGTSYTVNINRVGGFAGAVDFSASGLPTGAGVTFNPASAPGNSSAMSITTAGNTPTGTYTITITGTNGSLTHTATVTLVVNPVISVDFSVAATPASRTVTQGFSTTYSVSLTRTGGFTGAVKFTASGLPTGASASFSPNNTTGNASTMSVSTNGNTTPPGTYTVTITGTSGSLIHSTTVTLVVNLSPPDYALSSLPGTRTITGGASTTYRIRVTPRGGFAGAVTMSASGLPGSSTASFNPNPVNSGTEGSTMTVQTAAATPKGTFTITVQGVSGSLVHTVKVKLTVN